MTGKEKFLEFINLQNNFSSERGFNYFYEFVCFEYSFGILKETSILKSGLKRENYLLYVTHYLSHDEIDFCIVRIFRELENAKKALKALTIFD